MAAFPARDWDAFAAHWTRILDDRMVFTKAILFNGQVAGNVVTFEQAGDRLVGYWVGREYWGKGVATRALSEFLEHVTTRPLHARVAKRNIASRRVLEKCGFVICGEDKCFSEGDGEEIEEFILQLASSEPEEAR